MYEATSSAYADMFTKACSNAVAWRHACDLINIVDPFCLRWLALQISFAILQSPFPPNVGGGGTQQ
ncbi:MAG: hypothetical protein ACKPKO_28690, partial [Candidatus Fonsibacter sp.]